ncbi:MAG: sigma-70 family RNA polymerase sigma factor [Coprococcus phoceensis]
MTRVFIWKNNSPQEWEEISFSAFSKARRNGCFTGCFFVETVKMFRDEDDRIIMECSRKDFEKYQQEDRHSRYLQEHEKSCSIFPASHVGDRDGTEEGYQDTDLFVDESVDTAEQAIQNLLLEDLHQALLKLSPAERDFILSYYEMKIPNATCLAQRYGITRQAADKRLKKIEEKIKKLVAIF